MKFKKIFIPLLAFIGLCSTINNPSFFVAKAEEETYTFYLENIFENVHNNNLEDISEQLFTYGLRHGSLSTSSGKGGDGGGAPRILPGCVQFDRKDATAKKYISSADYDLYIDSDSVVYSKSDDRLIVKFIANENIEIRTSIETNSFTSDSAGTSINHYISDSYNETSKQEWLVPDSSITNLEGASTSLFDRSFFIKQGQTFYWEWGFQFEDQRIADFGKLTSGFKFEIKRDTYVQKEVKNEEYFYFDLVKQCAAVNGKDLIPNQTTWNPSQTLVSIGMLHGDVKKGVIERFTYITPESLGAPFSGEPTSSTMQNWHMSTLNGDGVIIKIVALQKISLNIKRASLGNDYLAGATLNLYVNNNLVRSHDFVGNGDSIYDFAYNVILEQNDTLYWEFINYSGSYSILGMGDDGSQYTALPSFKAVEISNIIERNISVSNFANGIISSGEIEQEIGSNLGLIKALNGQRELNTLVDASISQDYVGSSGAKINKQGEIIISGGNSFTFKISAKSHLAVYLNFLQENSLTNVKLAVYQFVSNVSMTHLLFEFDHIDNEVLDQIDSPLILNRNDFVFIEFIGISGQATISSFRGFRVLEKAIGDGLENPYPINSSTDYSNEFSLNHEQIAYETARIRNKPIVARDFNVSLLTGKVSEEKKDSSYPFSYIKYDSGIYLEGTIDQSMIMTGSNNQFDGDNFAAVEYNRIKTSKANSVVYKLTATISTKLELHHGATNSGWIKTSPSEDPQISFVYLQSNGVQYKKLEQKNVESHINPVDAFNFEYHLKQGDTAYLVFQSDSAYQRNLNINFAFTSIPEAYNDALRENIFSKGETFIYSYDVISDSLRNNCQGVSYEGTLDINYCHGDIKNPEQFVKSECTGDGSGTANDALFTGGPAVKKAGFQRWQIQAGKLSDNAIMFYKALKNIHLSLKHDATKESWASFSSFKYYIMDTDGFIDFKCERYVSSDLEDDYFGYDIDLLSGQSLVISYCSNDDSSHAVVDLVYKIFANTDSFDIANVNDFSAARRLQSIKDVYKNELHARMDSLNEDDYSMSNWSKIEMFVDEFDVGIDVLTTEEEVIELYEKCSNGINEIYNIEQDALLLAQTKVSSLLEARQTIEDNKQYFLDKTISSIEKRYSSLEWKINASKSVTSIKVALKTFQSYVLNLGHDKVNLQNGLIIGGSVVGAILLAFILLTYVIKKTGNKKLLIVSRSTSSLKLENNAEYLMPQKGLKWKAFLSYMKKYWPLYAMVLPMVLYLFIFSYIPMGGLSLAFKDFDFRAGIWSSPWATTDGRLDVFKYFKQLFDNPEFMNSVSITLKISALRLACGFFIPIIITILLTEIKSKRFSKGFQIISYLPHFLSWIVIYGILIALTTSGSPVQRFFANLFGKEIGFFSDPNVFLWLVIFSNIWKEAGWSTIIYFAAAASINPELYEACDIDGASRWQRILKVTLPGLVPAISINLILQASGFVYGGFDQIFAMTGNGVNQAILPYVNITEIFLYQAGITSFEYSLATVVGLFNSVISLVLVLMANHIIKRIGGDGLW